MAGRDYALRSARMSRSCNGKPRSGHVYRCDRFRSLYHNWTVMWPNLAPYLCCQLRAASKALCEKIPSTFRNDKKKRTISDWKVLFRRGLALSEIISWRSLRPSRRPVFASGAPFVNACQRCHCQCSIANARFRPDNFSRWELSYFQPRG